MMEDVLKITEVSLYIVLQDDPKTPFDKSVPFAVDNRGHDIERIVIAHAGTESLPEWLVDCKKGYLKFAYISGYQNIECTFKKELLLLTISGIKYEKYDDFLNLEINKLFDILNTKPASNPKTMYKATMVKNIGAVWDRDAIADIITNDCEISQVAAVSEKVSTLGNRYLFSVSVETETQNQNNTWYARITIRNDEVDNKKIVVTMSRLQDVSCSVRVASIIDKIFNVYGKQCLDNTDAGSPGIGSKSVSGIIALRNELPELFINNYTRECPVLPIMLSKEQAYIVSGYNKRVIFYPVDNSGLGRFYTAPNGYFVGLKKNRLGNRNIFPCLVTCYLHDHMLREGSETHMYYMGGKTRNKGKSMKPIPRFLGYGISKYYNQDDNHCLYDRVRATSFVGAIEAAINQNIDTESVPWCPQVVKQEMWDIPDTDIMNMIKKKECGPLAYRYFEELLGLSIHVLVIKKGMLEAFVPKKCLDKEHKYIWEPPYSNHIIIFETTKVAYGNTMILYDILINKRGIAIFNNDDPAVMYVVSNKMAESVRPNRLEGLNVVKQLIDERGKCRVVITDNGECVATLTKPLTVPVMPKAKCFLDSHVRKMNTLKVAMGIPATDLQKCSTNDMLYFPNDNSFKYWLKRYIAKHQQC